MDEKPEDVVTKKVLDEIKHGIEQIKNGEFVTEADFYKMLNTKYTK